MISQGSESQQSTDEARRAQFPIGLHGYPGAAHEVHFRQMTSTHLDGKDMLSFSTTDTVLLLISLVYAAFTAISPSDGYYTLVAVGGLILFMLKKGIGSMLSGFDWEVILMDLSIGYRRLIPRPLDRDLVQRVLLALLPVLFLIFALLLFAGAYATRSSR